MSPRDDPHEIASTSGNPLDALPSWLLSRVAAHAHRIVQRRLSEAGFTGYEYRVLAALTENRSRTQTEIGRAAALDGRDVTHTVRALHDRSLISRSMDGRDTRVVLVGLTPAGREAWSRLALVMEEAQRDLLDPFSHDEATQFIRLLHRLRATQHRVRSDATADG